MKKLIVFGGGAIAPVLLSIVIQTPKLFFILSSVFGFGISFGSTLLKILFGTVIGGVLGSGNVFLGFFAAF